MARRRIVAAALLGVAAFAVGAGGVTRAAFTDAPPVGENAFSSATLQPPTGLGAVAGCQFLAPKITLAWTATSSTFADGYDVYRGTADGGPYSLRAHVSGRTTVGYVDTSGLSLNTTYYYVLRSTASNWTSANSGQATATTPLICLI